MDLKTCDDFVTHSPCWNSFLIALLLSDVMLVIVGLMLNIEALEQTRNCFERRIMKGIVDPALEILECDSHLDAFHKTESVCRMFSICILSIFIGNDIGNYFQYK